MEFCLVLGCGLGFVSGLVVLFRSAGALYGGIEALLLFGISALCFCTLALLAELKRGWAPPLPPTLVVKPRAGERY